MLLTQSSQKSPHLGWCCAFQWGGQCIIQSSICSTACQTHIKAVKVAPGWQAAHSSGLPTSRNFNFVSLHKIEPGIATVKVDHMYDAKAVQLCTPSITTLQTKQPYFVILCNVQMWLFSFLDTPILLHTSTLLDNTLCYQTHTQCTERNPLYCMSHPLYYTRSLQLFYCSDNCTI